MIGDSIKSVVHHLEAVHFRIFKSAHFQIELIPKANTQSLCSFYQVAVSRNKIIIFSCLLECHRRNVIIFNVTIRPNFPSNNSSNAFTPNNVASTLSNAVGLPPRCTWPNTVSRISAVQPAFLIGSRVEKLLRPIAHVQNPSSLRKP